VLSQNYKSCSTVRVGADVVSVIAAYVAITLYIFEGDSGSTAIKVLCYKSEGRWFDSIWCHWNFSLTYNPSDRTMVMRSTQPLTEMSTRSISWG